MKFKKISAIISFVLCFSVLISSTAIAQEQQDINGFSQTEYSENGNAFFNAIAALLDGINSLLSKSATDAKGDDVKVNFIFAFFRAAPDLGSEIKQVFWFGHKVKIISYSGNFAYVKDADSEDKGYIHTLLLKDTGGKLSINRSYDHVYVGATNLNNTTELPRMQATYDGSGEIRYSTDNPDIIYVDQDTGLITGKNPGKANFIASVNGKSVSRPVHCIYKWKKAWTGKALTATKVRTGPGTGYTEITTLAKGSKFIVGGDEGGSDGWAYGNVQGTNTWGFVKIGDISTKGTVSQYSSFKIGYPIKDTTIKYISSPYAERSNDLHRGFDITGGGSYIYGKELVSPVNGKVVFVNISCTSNNTKPSYGYCITIESNGGEYPKTAIKDSVTNKHFTITFMHMSEAPKLKEGDPVKVGDVVGKIGNTGNVSGSPGVNPIGTHLHLEINNMAAIMGSNLRTDFTYNINPIYFYMDVDFGFNTNSSAYKNSGAYWYGPNSK